MPELDVAADLVRRQLLGIDQGIELSERHAQLASGVTGPDLRLFVRLANVRQDEHPDDSIPIFQREVEQLIGTKNNRGYADAVSLMDHVRILLTNAGRPADFDPYAAGVRTAHKPERNLMKLLDQRGW